MKLASHVYLSSHQRLLLRAGFGILTFHKIGLPPRGTIDPFEYQTAARLEQKLAALQAAGFTAATLAERESTARFAVTFDDGYACALAGALPVLAQRKVTAINFLVAGKLGGVNEWDLAKGDVTERLMDAAQVRTWLAAGHQIGSHSLTHPNLRKIPLTAAREEISASRKKLEDEFGVAVRHFCYPYGSYNDAIRDLVREAGYATASTVKHGVPPPGHPPFDLPRIIPLTPGELFRKVLHRLGRRWKR